MMMNTFDDDSATSSLSNNKKLITKVCSTVLVEISNLDDNTDADQNFAVSVVDSLTNRCQIRLMRYRNCLQNFSYCLLLLAGFLCLNILSVQNYNPNLESNVPNAKEESTKNSTTLPLPTVLITVKTTQRFHRSRVQTILDTWYEFAPNDVRFFILKHICTSE